MAVESCDFAGLPQFTPIQPSLENISDLLSIIDANANVIRISKETNLKKEGFFGCIGFGPVDKIFSCKKVVEDSDFLHLDSQKNGELSFALVNITYPNAFDGESDRPSVASKVEKLRNAAFAQNFISRIEIIRKADSDIVLSNCFALVFRAKKVYLLSRSQCWDETAFFKTNVWSKDDNEHIVASFKSIIKNHEFKERHGRLLAVVADKKLQIKKELDQLQEKYSEKYGSYDNDKTMSKEDWANVSALNATISEAESFELVIEGPKGRRLSGKSSNGDTNSVAEDERYEAFCKIKATERELWAEQERFKYSMIPGRDVLEARKEFFNQLATGTESFSRILLTRTPCAANTKYNLMHRRCLSTGHDRQKIVRKRLFSGGDESATPRKSKRRLRE